jgi:hypothetical protein
MSGAFAGLGDCATLGFQTRAKKRGRNTADDLESTSVIGDDDPI